MAAMHLLLVMIMWPSLARGASFSIVDYGAKAGGTTDSSAALKKTWTAACSSTGPATISVPSGKFMVAAPVVFSGGKTVCKNEAITFKIDGVLLAPADYNVFSKTKVTTWLLFDSVVGVTITGGTIDGQGFSLHQCKLKPGSKCPDGATNLIFSNSHDIVITGLTSLNSQLYHISINGCKNVKLLDVTIKAAGNSLNTDGIHFQGSTGVTIYGAKVSTGDDCVSIGSGTTNLWIEKFKCGPGHGISIGSLAKSKIEPGVQNVTVKSVEFTGSTNGVRIKSWAKETNGFVKNVYFWNCTMTNVQNPIIIDQHYCPSRTCPPTDVSGLAISDVTYEDIHGSSATEIAVALGCSSKHPCANLKLMNVKLTYNGKEAKAACDNAKGTASGTNSPPSCLK